MPGDFLERIMTDLAGHPGATSTQIAARVDGNPHLVYWLLDAARSEGLCRKYHEGRPRTWRWEATPAPPTEGGTNGHV
jgi:hypothetical protein